MPNINQTELERTFSDIAYAHLRDKSNSLLDYLLGFQLIKSGDDGKRAVGIFGFKIGDGVYYAPTFFLNGEIRGLEALYAVDSDLFAPMTDEWINSIINRSDVKVGTPDNRSRKARGVGEPNYRKFKNIPGGGSIKLGQDIQSLPEALALHGGVAGLAETMSSFPEDREPVAPLPESVRLLGKVAQAGFMRDLRDNKCLRQHVESYYNLLDFAPDLEKQAEEEKKPKDLLIISGVTDAGVDKLTDAQRKDVLAGGVAVVDGRSDDEKAELYTTESARQLVSPTHPGVYEILMADGQIKQMLALTAFGRRSEILLKELDGPRWASDRMADAVFAVTDYVKGLDEVMADLPEPSKARRGKVYSFTTLSGEASQAYEVLEVLNSLDNSTTLKVRRRYGSLRDGEPGGSVPAYGFDVDKNSRTEAASEVSQIIVTPDKTSKPLYYKGKLVVSDKHFRLLELSGEYEDHFSHADFGDFNTLLNQLDKVAAAVDAWQVGDDLVFRRGDDVRQMDKIGAYHFLIGECGVTKEAADQVLEELCRSATRYYVKSAARLEFEDPSDPTSGGLMSGHHLSTEPEVLEVTDSDQADNSQLYEYDSPFGGGQGGGQPSTLDLIEKAVQAGDKEVFDAAGLNALIKAYVPTDLVDRYIPSITVGMDRLGRILFLIYWHYEEFEDRYGDDEVSDMLDNIRSVFEQLGDMVLSLKKRTLAGDPEHFGLGISPELESDHG